MAFRRSTLRYGETPEPVTPYQKAAQVWDERIGSARVQAKNWRLMAFGSLALSAGLAVALVYQTLRGTVVPWVVQVDKLGQALVAAPAEADYRPSDPGRGADALGSGGSRVEPPAWARDLARRQRLTQAGFVAAGALREGDRPVAGGGPDLKDQS